MNCRYYTEKTLSWMLNNKLIVFLSLLCFCLFVSTLALSGQKGRLINELDEIKAGMTSTTEAPSESTPEVNPDETAPETNPDGTAPETNPDGTAPETNPDETAPETKPDETAPETNPDQTAPETNPDQTAPETNPEENNSNATDSEQSSQTVLAKTETVESKNEEDTASAADKLKEIVESSKLLSLIAA